MMDQKNEMEYGRDYKYIPVTSVSSGEGVEVRPDLYCHTIQIVNICLAGLPDAKEFVLIDAGMPGSAEKIIAACEDRFGADARPKAIILTHGHFDHVGAIIELVQHWDVPVYAHPLELPFLTGKQSYPEPDASVEGGLVAKVSPYFPNEPLHLGDHVQPLAEDGSIPVCRVIAGCTRRGILRGMCPSSGNRIVLSSPAMPSSPSDKTRYTRC